MSKKATWNSSGRPSRASKMARLFDNVDDPLELSVTRMARTVSDDDDETQSSGGDGEETPDPTPQKQSRKRRRNPVVTQTFAPPEAAVLNSVPLAPSMVNMAAIPTGMGLVNPGMLHFLSLSPIQQYQALQALQTLVSLGYVPFPTQPPTNQVPVSGQCIPSQQEPQVEELPTVRLTKKQQLAAQRKMRRDIIKRAREMAVGRKLEGKKPYFVRCDSFGKPQPPHRNMWVSMLRSYCSVFDPSIDNINAQPHRMMNAVKDRLDKAWEYIGFDLSQREFKSQVNVYLKNRRYSLKQMIEANEDRPEDCCLEHWVNLQRLLQSEAKREQAARNVAMRAMVAIPRHVDRGGQEPKLGRKPTSLEINTKFAKEKGRRRRRTEAAHPSGSETPGTSESCIPGTSGTQPILDEFNLESRLANMESQLATIQAIWTQRNQANIVSDQVTTTPKECNVVNAPIASSIDVLDAVVIRDTTVEAMIAPPREPSEPAPEARVEETIQEGVLAGKPKPVRKCPPRSCTKKKTLYVEGNTTTAGAKVGRGAKAALPKSPVQCVN